MFNAIYPVIGNQTNLPFYLSGIGISDPEWHIVRDKGLVSHQILFTSGGEGCIKIDGHTYICRPGNIFYVSPGVVHEYYPVKKDDWCTNWMVFRGEYLSEMMTNMGFPKYYFKNSTNIQELRNIFEMIYNAAGNPVRSDEKCSTLIYEYIIETRRIFLGMKDNSVKGVVADAIAYMDANYEKDITLGQLSEMCGISEQYFCRIFRCETGLRPMEYLTRRRISEARILIRNTDLSIQEIGRRAGYNDSNYFGIVFKKYVGISPGGYRKNRKKNN